ncbi:concanavalin A-like lectin/glucanase domain-containing protein [Radiomyces spectabilis]|uniref:concanavalin A-like lectin/glucanase domain-containing protein n=1 Tax=Radiomyces spectabilis TaxID=64574 RepID=UPI002220E074|nr:concanavalin A-like lectin/glucanase domain-containing protein [Radiomyces spectabilis]KAI8391283.1 concanavalin A-like lectin/glucanase domain-containing protein [Radiomyces spectabilis]
MDYTLRGATENDYARAFKHNNVRVNNGTIQLTVKNEGGKHSSGSFATRRDDFLYGTYRAYMKTSNISGTVAAFFFYRNRTAEIDIETLSRLQNPWKTYLAVQPQLYNKDGSAAPETSDKHILAFNPTTDFHEYRFDWLPGSVTFYVDGHVLNTMTTNVPDSAGRIIVSHWTDGNPNFSGGPPSEDAQLTIANMTMFFNSSRATNILSCEKAQNACKMIPGSDFSSKHHHSDAPRISVPFMTILLLLLVACI